MTTAKRPKLRGAYTGSRRIKSKREKERRQINLTEK